jgi:hypothetical protein
LVILQSPEKLGGFSQNSSPGLTPNGGESITCAIAIVFGGVLAIEITSTKIANLWNAVWAECELTANP